MHFYVLFLLFIIFSANTFFYIGPWWHKSGVFNIADVGNASIWLSLFLLPFFVRHKNDLKILKNPISALIITYVLFVCIHISLASLYYGQSLLDGLVGVRHQFYYLSFFLFLILLNDKKKIFQFFNILIILSIFLLIFSLLNYLGLTIFHHKWAKGQGDRYGITRAFIPGMSIVSFSCLWAFVKWTNNDKKTNLDSVTSLLLLFAHFFRQSRMRLIAMLVMITSLVMVRKQWKLIITLIAVSVIAFVVLEISTERNVITALFSYTYKDVVQKTGSWKPRLEQIKLDLLEFKKHPWIGSGVSAIRSLTEKGGTRLQEEMAALSYKFDLGYTHWLKSYGLAGVAWLIFFFGAQLIMVIKAQSKLKGDEHTLAVFNLTYLGYLAISFITLNYLMFPKRIIMVCLNAAIITRMYFNSRYIKKTDDLVNF